MVSFHTKYIYHIILDPKMRSSFYVILITTFVAMVNFAYSQWEPDVRLTSNQAKSNISSTSQWNVAASGNFVHVTWQEARDLNWEIYYKRSSDGGVTWGADTRLTNQFAKSDMPSIVVSGSVVHVVWEDERDGNAEIYYKRSTDDGLTWSADTRMTNAVAELWIPSIGASGSIVGIAWQDNRDGNPEIYFKRSTDAGASWEADVRLTNDTAHSYFSSVAVSGSLVHVVWTEYRDIDEEIYYKRSTDAGATWGADTRLINAAGYSDYPSVAASGSSVHVVWYDDRENSTFQIYHKRSTDGGATWEAETPITSEPTGTDYGNIAVSGAVVHVVWDDYRDGGCEIYYKRSTDDGASWGTDTRLTNAKASDCPSIAVSGSVVHVVFEDTRDGANREIYYKRNPAGNVTGIKELDSDAPDSFSLSQNYPNPFQRATRFEFHLAQSGLIDIAIYDVLGKKVMTLVHEQKTPGRYASEFDADDLPHGIYYLTMRAGRYSETRKFIHIK